MLFSCTQRHYAVCALRELPEVARRDHGFWNVISVLEANVPPIASTGFRKRIRVACDDVVDAVDVLTHGRNPPVSAAIDSVFRFADDVFGEPLLLHCMFGQSRSTAMALLLIMRDMKLDGFSATDCALESRAFLLAMRPQAKPNGLILDAGLCQIFNEMERIAIRNAWQNPKD